MTLESLSLLPELQKLPIDESAGDLDFNGLMARLSAMDRDHWSIVWSAGVEESLKALFDKVNVPDDVLQAYGLAYSTSVLPLPDHYLQMVGRGEESVTGFLSNLKGKVAELRVGADLEDRYPGYAFELAPNPTQPDWDLVGRGPEGMGDIYVQVKMGMAGRVSDVIERMEVAPENVLFAVSREIHERIAEVVPELSPSVLDSGIANLEFTEGVQESVARLAAHRGIDIPDSIGEMLPYVTEVVLSVRLIFDMVSVERDFKDVELNDRTRVHVLKALTLMSRFGITSVCTVLGSAVAPGAGTAVGAIGGAGFAIVLNRRLRPRMLEIAMHIAGIDDDDLLYMRRKAAIDRVGASLAATSAV